MATRAESIQDGRKTRGMLTSWWRRAALLVLYVCGLILAWDVAVRVLNIRPYLIPAPGGVWTEFSQSAAFMVRHTAITVAEALAGFGLAVVVGVGLAVLIVYAPLLRTVVLPTLVAVNATPKVAVAPVMIIWLGLGAPSKVAMAFLLSFFPIVINSARGLNDVPADLLNIFRLLRASGLQTFLKARLPNSLPAMFDGFKIALPIAMIGAIIGEFVAAREGIGYQIMLAYAKLDTELVFAMVITVAVISTLLFQALVWIERYFLAWRPSGPEL